LTFIDILNYISAMYSSYPGHFFRIPRQLSLKKLTLLKKSCPSYNQPDIKQKHRCNAQT